VSWYSPKLRQLPKRLPRQRPLKTIPSALGDQGIVGNWLFYYLKGGDHLHDFSPNGNHGTLNGPVWKDGRYGWALEFDGGDDYVDLGDYKYLADQGWTVLAWININTYKDYNNIVGAGKPDGSKYLKPGGYISTDANGFLCDYTDVEGWITSDTTLSTNTWYLAVFQLEPDNTYNFYLNGEADGSYNVTPENYNGQYIMRWIGEFGAGAGRYFNGIIGEVRIYNRVLSSVEIQTHYNKTKGIFRG